jgi:hypothetical protein
MSSQSKHPLNVSTSLGLNSVLSLSLEKCVMRRCVMLIHFSLAINHSGDKNMK